MTKQTGTVKFFNTAKGFGFIKPDQGDKDLFFHASNIEGGVELRDGQKVSYVEGQGRKGPEATKVSAI